MNVLPQPSSEIHAQYQTLIQEIEQTLQSLVHERFTTVLQCRPGCSECCVQFTVLPLEAAIIQIFLQEKTVARDLTAPKCIMLRDDMCQIYSVRPVICRTQGVPLAHIDEDRQALEVLACHLNFPEDYPLVQDDLLFMDAFNLRLSELNSRYCEESGCLPTVRIPIKELL